jgi:hypothetical protein
MLGRAGSGACLVTKLGQCYVTMVDRTLPSRVFVRGQFDRPTPPAQHASEEDKQPHFEFC